METEPRLKRACEGQKDNSRGHREDGARVLLWLVVAALIVQVPMLLLSGCSTEKNTAQTRFWHSFTANYNTYYNGAQAYIEGSLAKEKGNVDNFTEMIPLYTVGNKKTREVGKSNFDRAIEKSQKAIKQHSIRKRPEWTKNRKKTARDIEWLNRREYGCVYSRLLVCLLRERSSFSSS